MNIPAAVIAGNASLCQFSILRFVLDSAQGHLPTIGVWFYKCNSSRHKWLGFISTSTNITSESREGCELT